jgi:hypothetical protein
MFTFYYFNLKEGSIVVIVLSTWTYRHDDRAWIKTAEMTMLLLELELQCRPMPTLLYQEKKTTGTIE